MHVAERRWTLVVRERERLLRLARTRLGSTPDAEDCVQEAMIRAATFERLDETRVGPLLTTITLRLCVDQHRRRAREQRMLRGHTAPVGEDVASRLCEQAAGAWLLEQTVALGVREREVLLARASGLTPTETARHLRISVKSAESAFTRARKQLRTRYHAEMSR
ncbi:sigma-70 family RNA polymerase sigma factor [Streptomyces sp. A7024]|uniref:RNA polymerase sigma factor SigS n=1 Tax=Streptomyces coryli TaxID=1128680 RepID=A0A6G4U8G4_9ACTN|nr:sigma-70 family RNA polymerase sigma factor [Streptomyces coryli]NGN67996.1 sigma-70 family RNA polymerase sigma factor [Streptomyces coryli]